MSNGSSVLPNRRTDLKTQEVADELMLYDPTNDRAHVLNPAAAFVWKQCDGTHTIDQIAAAMRREYSPHADVKTVYYALDQLQKKHLLRTPIEIPHQWRHLTRRQFLAGATAAAVVLAVVTSLAAPAPAHAQSGCVGSGGPCELGNPGVCCSDTCTNFDPPNPPVCL